MPPGRRTWGRAQDDHIVDPYQRQRKLHEPTVCPQCNAVFHDGTWQWMAPPVDAEQERCPACRRIDEKLPAGIVTLSGPIVARQSAEVLHLVRHQEELEKREHPMNRIIGIEQEPDKITVTTTDVHLPRRIGEAMRHAFHGHLELDYDKATYFVRVDWSRPN
jgi:hypothetical protein